MHSKNKVITQYGLFENENGPRVLKSSVQQTCSLQECQRHKAYVTNYILILSLLSIILPGLCLLDAEQEHFRSNLDYEILVHSFDTYCILQDNGLDLEFQKPVSYMRDSTVTQHKMN